jgi:hypothetical protein
VRYAWYVVGAAACVAVGAIAAAIYGASSRPSLVPALVGLGGVVVGAVLAAVGELAVYVLRRRDELEARASDRQASVREGARLVRSELAYLVSYLQTCVNIGIAGPYGKPDSTLPEWSRYRALLVGEVDEAGVDVLTSAYLAARIALDELDVRAKAGDSDLSTLSAWVARIRPALTLLRSLSEPAGDGASPSP